ncbi:MAG: N-acetyltransferase [Planctomycetota bacterium]|jgi:putative acetyltransferase|nr:N-acetyltransferase [Planctomycetota bacterium]
MTPNPLAFSNIVVRDERPSDTSRIRQVVKSAFGQNEEADLVDRLRCTEALAISLVSVDNAQTAGGDPARIIGHLAFSPVSIEQTTTPISMLGLAPVAIVPEYQGQGIGSRLIKAGLTKCRREGVDLVVVLGHPWCYPRFGFRPAHLMGLTSEYNSSPEAFMVLELTPGVLSTCAGLVRYHRAFDPTYTDGANATMRPLAR